MNDLSASSQSTRKLRSSCDSCGVAKTKCDRGRPQCGRCVSMNLSCVYGPSRQFGKRPRRRLDTHRDVLPREPLPMNGDANMEGLVNDGGLIHENNNFDNTMFISPLPSNWSQLDSLGSVDFAFTSEPSNSGIPTPPCMDLRKPHRCFHEANEILESLTVPHQDPAGCSASRVVLEMSRVLEINKLAIESVSRFLNCDCAKTMPHLLMIYASITSRVLFFYQEAAGYAVWSNKGQPTNASNTSDTSSGNPKCFAVTALPFTIGNFSIDEPSVQLAFKNQLIIHEVKKASSVVNQFVSLAADQEVMDGDKMLYMALSTWLKTDYEKTVGVFRDSMKQVIERMEI